MYRRTRMARLERSVDTYAPRTSRRRRRTGASVSVMRMANVSVVSSRRRAGAFVELRGVSRWAPRCGAMLIRRMSGALGGRTIPHARCSADRARASCESSPPHALDARRRRGTLHRAELLLHRAAAARSATASSISGRETLRGAWRAGATSLAPSSRRETPECIAPAPDSLTARRPPAARGRVTLSRTT